MKTRLTPKDLDELIEKVEVFQPDDSTVTFCTLQLINGCQVNGESNVIDPANYNAEMGKEAAFKSAREKIWQLEGYALKRSMFDLVLRAARAAHEANRVYCMSIGDTSQPTWNDAPDWQTDSAIAGVKSILADPNTTPEQSHMNWFLHKQADGWVYGPKKDPKLKEHPCMVPYSDLPAEQKHKDALFGSVVRAVLGG